MVALASWLAFLLLQILVYAGYYSSFTPGDWRALKALWIIGWLEGENPLLTALTITCKLERIRVFFFAFTTFSTTTRAIILALKTLTRPSFPLRAFIFLPFLYTDIA